MNPRTNRNLAHAMECAAMDATEYNRFAARARMEDEWGLAKLFQDMADTDRTEYFPKEAELAGLIASSPDNLRNAMDSDRKEIKMFIRFASEAKEDGDADISSMFEKLGRDRANRYAQFEAALRTMGVHSNVWTVDDSQSL
jgi:rubrerythrin